MTVTSCFTMLHLIIIILWHKPNQLLKITITCFDPLNCTSKSTTSKPNPYSFALIFHYVGLTSFRLCPHVWGGIFFFFLTNVDFFSIQFLCLSFTHNKIFKSPKRELLENYFQGEDLQKILLYRYCVWFFLACPFYLTSIVLFVKAILYPKQHLIFLTGLFICLD